MTRLPAALCGVALLALASGAAAQETERDDRRIDRMERTVRQMEQIIRQGAATGRPVVVAPETLPFELDALRRRIDDLEATLRSQNSTVEALTQELGESRRVATAANDQIVTLTTRLATVEARPVAAPEPLPVPPLGPEEAAATAPSPAGDPSTAFSRARQQLLEGDYAGAGAAFEGFAARWPADARTPEARYWQGETLFIREEYGDAAQAYIAALRGRPTTPWAPDAAIKLASTLVELKRPTDACGVLADFDRRYAASNASVKSRAAAIRARAAC